MLFNENRLFLFNKKNILNLSNEFKVLHVCHLAIKFSVLGLLKDV